MKLIPNNHKKYKDGSVHYMNTGNSLTIIGKVSKRDPEHLDGLRNNYYVEFKTGYKTVVQENSIQKANCFDPMFPSYLGVGFLGVGNHKRTFTDSKDYTPEYRLWTYMLKRCYDESTLKKYPTYRNVKVAERWHNFQNFCDDLPKLPNYELWKEYTGQEYHLDKDLNQSSEEQKIYSVDTCQFLHKSENTSLSALTGMTFYSYNTVEKTYEIFYNMSKFSEENKVNYDVLTKALYYEKQIKDHFYGVLPKNTENILSFIEQRYEIYLKNEEKKQNRWGVYHIKTKNLKTFSSREKIGHMFPSISQYLINDACFGKVLFVKKYYVMFRIPDVIPTDLVEYAKNYIKEWKEKRKELRENTPKFIARKGDEELVIEDIAEFAKIVGRGTASIIYVLHGARKSIDGWILEIIED